MPGSATRVAVGRVSLVLAMPGGSILCCAMRAVNSPVLKATKAVQVKVNLG
jgi:hypothetical protein